MVSDGDGYTEVLSKAEEAPGCPADEFRRPGLGHANCSTPSWGRERRRKYEIPAGPLPDVRVQSPESGVYTACRGCAGIRTPCLCGSEMCKLRSGLSRTRCPAGAGELPRAEFQPPRRSRRSGSAGAAPEPVKKPLRRKIFQPGLRAPQPAGKRVRASRSLDFSQLSRTLRPPMRIHLRSWAFRHFAFRPAIPFPRPPQQADRPQRRACRNSLPYNQNRRKLPYGL